MVKLFLLFQNECSFVSLRDVERAMKVIMWFYSNSELIDRAIHDDDNADEDSDSSEESSNEDVQKIEQVKFFYL